MSGYVAAWCYALLAWTLLEIVLRSWARPERLDGSWAWTWPAPVRGAVQGPAFGRCTGAGMCSHGPMFTCGRPLRSGARQPVVIEYRAASGPPDVGMVPCVSPRGEAFWSAPELVSYQNSGAVIDTSAWAGATDEWSPILEQAFAERRMLPLDDVDEWLAERVRRFDHELSRIGARRVWLGKGLAQCTVDEELEAFQRGSMALHEYRSMILDSTGGYTMREAAQVEALLISS